LDSALRDEVKSKPGQNVTIINRDCLLHATKT